MTNLANLNREGRKPLFSEAKALELLENRKMFDPGQTVRQFIAEMVNAGEIEKPCSVATMQRLLTGKMFPGLVDPKTGRKYSYTEVPKAEKGCPKRPAEFSRETGEPMRPMTRIRRELYERAVKAATEQAAVHFSLLTRQLTRDLRTLTERIEKLERGPVAIAPVSAG